MTGAALKLRPALASFASVMQFRMACKKFRGNWRNASPMDLLESIQDEEILLMDAITEGEGDLSSICADAAVWLLILSELYAVKSAKLPSCERRAPE